jgi:hypothetical protein
VDTCELGFQHFSVPYYALQGVGVWFWVGLQKIWSKKYLLFGALQSVSVVVLMVLVVEREQMLQLLGLFQI